MNINNAPHKLRAPHAPSINSKKSEIIHEFYKAARKQRPGNSLTTQLEMQSRHVRNKGGRVDTPLVLQRIPSISIRTHMTTQSLG